MIEAWHWGTICAAVEAHARELYPHDEKMQQQLIEKLLCIQSEEGLHEHSPATDVTMHDTTTKKRPWWRKLLGF